MIHKIILLDSCVIINKKFDHLKRQYPPSKWVWAISGDTFFELTNGSDKTRAYSKMLEIYNSLGLRTVLDYESIINLECDFKLKDRNILYLKEWDRKLKACMKGNDPAFCEKIEDRRKEWKKCKESQIKLTEKASNCLEITMEEIHEQISLIIQHTIDGGDIDTLDEEIKKTFYKCRNLLISHKNKIPTFAKKYPTCNSIFRIQGFVSTLRKLEDQDVFHFKVKNKTPKIKVDNNLIIDLRISAASLPYVHKFITAEPGLIEILRFLFPQYSNKLIFMKNNPLPQPLGIMEN